MTALQNGAITLLHIRQFDNDPEKFNPWSGHRLLKYTPTTIEPGESTPESCGLDGGYVTLLIRYADQTGEPIATKSAK
ncbi:hypothetical protein PAXRUDRAFT_830553 [Paxillus rubicundulus Ve08.2h10]|uniref:Uncharacterized protein n=1 Tax=Paxillus rubicundulus Ve08.2h10 TaxID=930991 RepID=A0A0D0E3R5_9AGAM|nr:hypothetical protein PAXRUDRAFT_830553 [Paxillus rubicundulus Ve08.2h10]